jgi:hypothetical protein
MGHMSDMNLQCAPRHVLIALCLAAGCDASTPGLSAKNSVTPDGGGNGAGGVGGRGGAQVDGSGMAGSGAVNTDGAALVDADIATDTATNRDSGADGSGSTILDARDAANEADDGFSFWPWNLVSVRQASYMGYWSHTVQAGFSSKAPVSCTFSHVASCRIAVCKTQGAVTHPVAGALSVLGGAVPLVLSPIQLNRWEPPKLYSFLNGKIMLWKGGEQITISAEGDVEGFPAFQGVVVATTPLQLISVTPSLPEDPINTPLEINRSSPMNLKWTGQSAGKVQALVTSDTPNILNNRSPVAARCDFPANAGSGEIPASVWGHFRERSALLDIMQVSTAEAIAGNQKVSLQVSMSLLHTGVGVVLLHFK